MEHTDQHLEDQDHNDTPNQWEVTCLELVGGHTPRRGLDDEDIRHTPGEGEIESTLAAVLEAFEDLTRDTKLEEDLVDIAAGFITSLHYVLMRRHKVQDDTASEIRRLDREFDGSEIKDVELQKQTNLAHQIGERIEGLEAMRDILTELVAVKYDHTWHPPRGNHVSERRPLSMAVVEARDFIKAKEASKRAALTPEGARVGFAGGKEYGVKSEQISTVWKLLDRARERHPDMVLVHGGGRGAEKVAACWANNRRVPQIVCTPDWKTHNKAAPFRRNDEMLKLDLIGLIAVPGNGITDNLVDKARAKRVPVKTIEA